jgi:co-chaperonin GroES (HSP10)
VSENILGIKLPPNQGLSHVEAHEEGMAQELIDQQFIAMTGKPFDMRPAGYLVALKIYVEPDELSIVQTDDGKSITLYRPISMQAEEKYQSCSALVCALGPEAYNGEKFSDSGPWCKVGDWVMIPRYEATAVSYRGVAVALIPDDRIMAVITDPTDVKSVKDATKF